MITTKIEARDLPDAWFQLLRKCLENGKRYEIDRGSYKGAERIELESLILHIKFPSTRPLIPDIPPHLGIPNPTDMEYIEQYLQYLMTPIVQENEQYSYGQRLNESNQIEQTIAILKKNHGTNQACMAIEQPSDILLSDPPCLRTIQAKIWEQKLHFHVYFRSWDIFNGVPSNLAALQLLKEYMSSSIKVNDGEIIAYSGGAHLYDHVEKLAEIRTNFAKGEKK